MIDSHPSELPRRRPVPGRQRTVRGKLMRLVLATTAIGVCVAGIAMLAYDLSVYRGSWAKDLANQADILAVSVAPALEFDDHEVAERNLGAMQVRPRVLLAALYTMDGKLYAAYQRNPDILPPAQPSSMGVHITGERVELAAPVTRNGERLGTIYLLARYDVLSRLQAYASIFALVMALSVAVAYLASRWLQRAITAPLDAMTDVARQIVDRRDYSLRATKTTDDEIGIVVLAFNAMLDEVEARARGSDAANAALAVSNDALQAEIEVRQTAEAALLDADRRKDEFLATLAHELRNPLAPIRHAVKLLDSKGADAQQLEWGRSVIGRQVQRMSLLLDDLLDVSRITRGRLNLKMEVVELRQVVDAALEVARPLINVKNHRLSVTLPPDRLMLCVDPLRLSQALSNLLTNAAKYTDDGGDIALTVTLSTIGISFIVKDTGIGLDPAALPKLFEIFSQLDPAIDRAEGGLGIGLALVKGLTMLHGGHVDAASAGNGLGSEFTIHLPRSRVVHETEPAAPAVPYLLADAQPNATAHASADGHAHAGGHADVHNPPPLRILIADDNHDAVDSLGMLLELDGYAVHVAHSGAEALALGRLHQPDVAIVDIGMPDMNGYEVAQTARREAWGKHVYLIALTGWGQSSDIQKATAAGFDRHLTKPVDPALVADLIAQLRDARAG